MIILALLSLNQIFDRVPVTPVDSLSSRSDVSSGGLLSRDIVFSILSEDGRRRALQDISNYEGNRVERNVGQSPQTLHGENKAQSQVYNTATFLINSGFDESHFERLFSQVNGAIAGG